MLEPGYIAASLCWSLAPCSARLGPGPSLSLHQPAASSGCVPTVPASAQHSAADKGRHLGFEVPPPAGQPGTSSPACLAAWKYFNVNCNSMKIGTTRSAPFPSFPSRCPRRAEPPQCRCHASFCILSACLHRPSGGLKSL